MKKLTRKQKIRDLKRNLSKFNKRVMKIKGVKEIGNSGRNKTTKKGSSKKSQSVITDIGQLVGESGAENKPNSGN